MNKKTLIEKMASSADNVPSQVDVIVVRQYALDELERRTKHFLAMVGEAYNLSSERGDWAVQKDRTLVRMPLGARAVVYHASGAMQLKTGLNPMESLFKQIEDRERLVKQVEDTASRLNIRSLVGQNESLGFEQLWQIKAAATDREGKAVKPILCRAIGTYRHTVGELPVWGPASVAVKVAGDGALDCLTVQIRESTGEIIDRIRTLSPEEASRRIYAQLSSLMGKSRIPVNEIASPQWLRFGYLSLPKRKAQRLLAPVYVAAIEINGPEERQAYLLAVSASDITYLPLCLNGSEALLTPTRSTG